MSLKALKNIKRYNHRLLPILYSAAPNNVIPFDALSYLLNSAEIKK